MGSIPPWSGILFKRKEVNILISISGLIGSGKDTAADYLCTFHGFKRASFAESLKDAVSIIFSWDRGLLNGSTRSSRIWREEIDSWWANRLGIPHLTPRWVLQQWGTDVLRTAFHDEIWIASLENKLRTSQDDIVITDARFPNELKMVKSLGGITLRANRGPDPEWLSLAKELDDHPEYKIILEEQYGIHSSEYSSVGLEYDYLLDNNSTIDSLYQQISTILEKTK